MMMRVWWNKAAYLMVAAKEGWDGRERGKGSNNLTFTRFYLPMILRLPEAFTMWDSRGRYTSKPQCCVRER